MKLDEFEIRFDNQRGVFAAGQNVSGHVVVKLTKPMKMRCKYIFYLSFYNLILFYIVRIFHAEIQEQVFYGQH